MKRTDITLLTSIAVVSAVAAFLVAGTVFNPPDKRTKVPVISPISLTFPDVKNDPSYQLFFFNGALDPTQPIQIGNTKNSTPFSSNP